MFLWVYLMLKEFKSCLSLSHVQETLRKLPKRLVRTFWSIALPIGTTVWVLGPIAGAMKPAVLPNMTQDSSFYP